VGVGEEGGEWGCTRFGQTLELSLGSFIAEAQRGEEKGRVRGRVGLYQFGGTDGGG